MNIELQLAGDRPRSTRTTSGPKEMFGTKCPSMMSRCSHSAPERSHARSASVAKRPKFAARSEGAIIIRRETSEEPSDASNLRRCFVQKESGGHSAAAKNRSLANQAGAGAASPKPGNFGEAGFMTSGSGVAACAPIGGSTIWRRRRRRRELASAHDFFHLRTVERFEFEQANWRSLRACRGWL